MSRSRKRDTDELEEVRAENRELKSIIKSLERQIKTLNKQLKNEFDAEDLIETEFIEKTPPKNKCSKCNKGPIKEVELGPRKLLICDHCGERKAIKSTTPKYKRK